MSPVVAKPVVPVEVERWKIYAALLLVAGGAFYYVKK